MQPIVNKNGTTVFMNKFTVLAKNKETYFIKRLTEEVDKESLLFIDPWTESDLKAEGDFILVRTSAVYGGDHDLDYLSVNATGKKVFNSQTALKILRTKKTQYELFENLGIPQVPWLDLNTTDVSVLLGFVQNYPVKKYLIKPHRGQGGRGIRLFSISELVSWFESAHDKEFILQPFIQGAQEYRYFFITDEWFWTLERLKSPNGLVANFTQEGNARSVDPDPRFVDIVEKISQIAPVTYGALDILIIENELFVLELNLVPGIEQLENLSGVNVISKLLRAVSKQL